MKGSSSAIFQLSCYSHPGIELGNTSYDYNKLKEEFEHLSVLPNKRFNLAEVGVIIGQDFYDLQRPLDYRLGKPDELHAVLTELGCVVSGPRKRSDNENVCHLAVGNVPSLAEQVRTWWDIETYASRFNVKSETKKERQAQEILESTTRFTEGRFEVGLLWNKPNAKLPNNYSAALGNLKSLERRLSKDPQLKQMYQDTIDKD